MLHRYPWIFQNLVCLPHKFTLSNYNLEKNYFTRAAVACQRLREVEHDWLASRSRLAMSQSRSTVLSRRAIVMYLAHSTARRATNSFRCEAIVERKFLLFPVSLWYFVWVRSGDWCTIYCLRREKKGQVKSRTIQVIPCYIVAREYFLYISRKLTIDSPLYKVLTIQIYIREIHAFVPRRLIPTSTNCETLSQPSTWLA